MTVNPSDAVEGPVEEEDVQEDGDVEEATATQEAAEGAESSGRMGSREGLQDALLSTEPNTPLHKVDSPWNPEEGGITRVYRGIQKLLDFNGTPAVVDVVVGVAEFVRSFEPAGDEDVDDQDEETEDVATTEGGEAIV